METKKVFLYKSQLTDQGRDNIVKPIVPITFSKNSELKQALNSMYVAWMPLNQVVYDSIQKNILSQAYDNDRDRFLKDISMDFTIVSMIFKEIPIIANSKENIDPVSFLKTFDIENLKSIFQRSAQDYSYHSLDDMKESQAIMYKYTAISSQTSKRFAMFNKVDPLSVYVLSVLRGLANCLLAWNYPRLFSRALKTQADGEGKLDDFIERVIGFSPNDLIMELLSTWNFDDETKDFIDDKKQSNLNSMIQKSVFSGEMTAKVHDPKSFPEAINMLDTFQFEVNRVNVETVIKREVQKTCEYYEKYAPNIFDLTMSIKERIKEAILAHAEHKLKKNVFVFQCGDDDVIKSFKKVYINVSDDKFSKKALEILRYDTIARAGFSDGCLYMFDEKANMLSPILKIGNRELSEYKEINCGKNSSCTVALIDALKCAVPIMRDGLSVLGESASYICASFGNSFKKGVLYLEIPSDSNEEQQFEQNIIPKFKAILRCLNECLGFSVN